MQSGKLDDGSSNENKSDAIRIVRHYEINATKQKKNG